MTHMFRTFVSGLILLLPLIITLAVVAWLGQFIINYVGPSSVVGQALMTIGFSFSASQFAAYVIGLVVFMVIVYLLGLAVESKLRSQLSKTLDSTMRRIPLIGALYDLIQRFVALMDKKDVEGLKSMSPVWCFFGGPQSAAVLALLPTPEPIMVGDTPYHAVLIPSAPLPVGGCLAYVPAAWVQPADVGVDKLVSIYVSMGVSSPLKIAPLPAAAPAKGKLATT
ncbi:DUF502 domain-containing protein [Pseudorhodoplanes sp.]|uniref:DUF502 domain-containing protein n=1 Tax=Pseudorhodoplanes sp. TaxID=1934341 RepID=UPI00391B8155